MGCAVALLRDEVVSYVVISLFIVASIAQDSFLSLRKRKERKGKSGSPNSSLIEN